MRYPLTVIALLFFASLGRAQIGFTSSYVHANLNFGAVDGSYLEDLKGLEGQLHYWFRLPNHRVEFAPTLYYSSISRRQSNLNSLRSIGFQLETNVYPFDFGGDCDCPTFGKQGPKLEKGLFIQIAPGLAYVDMPNSGGFESHVTPTLAGGLGLDIGLHNFVTLTPIATLRYHRAYKDEIPIRDTNGNQGETTSVNLLSYQLGIQISLRFDYKRY